METRNARAVFLLLIAGVLLVAPIWLVAYPPLLDYPNHLARSFVLAHLGDTGSPLGRFYRPDWGAYPYVASDLILTGLNRFVPAPAAGKLFLTLCVLALPLAAWFFLRQANPGQDHMALWTLLIAHNIFFLYGFLSFLLSLSVCFLAIGLWLRYLARPGLRPWLGVLAVTTALYFTHLVGFAIAGFVMMTYALWTRRDRRTLLFSGLVFLPGTLLFLSAWNKRADAAGGVAFHDFRGKLEALWAVLHGYSLALDLITLLALAAFFAAARWRNPEFRWNPRWVAVAAGLLVAYCALPEGYGDGAYFDIRVLPVLFVVLLAAAQSGRRGRRVALLAVLLFLVRTADLTRNFYAAQPELAGLAKSFSYTPKGALVLPIVEADDPGEEHVHHPFAHFWAYGIIEKQWFAPYLFDLHGVTPLRIKYEAYESDGFWDLSYEETPDWSDVQNDYDYVWAYNVPRFSKHLRAIAEPIYTSGRLVLFRVNKVPDER